ncbi:MAG: sulfurtransferase TusA family protein [Candidatus Lokiarchaeota archaeon]
MTDQVKNYEKTKKLDIRGRVCPMTFVYTKLALEDMEKGELLEVTLDFPAALKNIPKSCESQKIGKVIDVKVIESEKPQWIMKIRKI